MSYFDRYLATLTAEGYPRPYFPPSTLTRQTIYVKLVDFIAPAYPDLTEDDFARIAGIGYLYFQFILSIDTVIDERVISDEDKHLLLQRLPYFEYAVADLGRAFPPRSPFWNRFAGCKQQFGEAGQLERQLAEQRPAFTDALFLQLASGKSALCNGSVHALDTLAGRRESSAILLRCIRALHIAFQYRDDLGDFERDCNAGQWTQAQYHVQLYLEREELYETFSSPRDMHSAIYTSGIAVGMIEKSIGYYREALEDALQLGLPDMQYFIQREIRDCQNQIFEVNLLLEKTIALSKRSPLPRISQQAVGTESVAEEAESAARNFLLTELVGDGKEGWKDFMTTAGEGRSWTNTYVALQLAETGCQDSALQQVLRRIEREGDSTGAFNESMQRDGDSSTFTIAVLHAAGKSPSAASLDGWTEFQHASGGWVTYNDPQGLAARLELEGEGEVSGWITPKGCVSAAAAYVLAKLDASSGPYARSIAYLKSVQQDDGAIPAYWWSSNIYPTAYTLLAAMEAGTDARTDFVTGLRAYLHTTQTDEGYWTDGHRTPCPFYTALALRSLVESGTSPTEPCMRLAYNWLLGEQKQDGSWIATRKLRIPAPNVEHIDRVSKWRCSSFGTNVLVDDHNRYFTTATVLRSLHSFRSSMEEVTSASIMVL
jgi:hypothetical protein